MKGAKLKYNLMAKRIQKYFKIYMWNKKMKACKIIKKFIAKILRERKYSLQRIHDFRSLYNMIKVKRILRRRMRIRRSEILLKTINGYNKNLLIPIVSFIRHLNFYLTRIHIKLMNNICNRIKFKNLKRQLMNVMQ